MSISINDIAEANASAGLHFFSPDTLRFFNSTIGATVYGVWRGSVPGGQYFITSERHEDNPRMYTVRRYNPDAHTIDTIGGFQAYKTLRGAAKHAMRERDHEQATGEWEGKPT